MALSRVAVEEDDEIGWIFETDHACAKCSDAILLTYEVYLLRVVIPVVSTDGGLEYMDVEAEDRDYMYEPRYFEFGCWEDVRDNLREDLENAPSIQDDKAILDCGICESGICRGEYLGLATWGEVRCSQRMPEGEATHIFELEDISPFPICISCLSKMNDEICLWDDPVDQEGSCDEGTHQRCWRQGCMDVCLLHGHQKT